VNNLIICSLLEKLSLHVDVKERTRWRAGRADNMVSKGNDFLKCSVPNDGGPDWTRTSDPALIKRVL
jgi:hypothetical protein